MPAVGENAFYGVQFAQFKHATLQPGLLISQPLVYFPLSRIVVYTGDTDAAPDMILAKARDRFNMSIPDTNLTFIYLHRYLHSWE